MVYFCIDNETKQTLKTTTNMKTTMIAKIAKDENFNTIGMLVTEGNERLFAWGVNPDVNFNYVKVVDMSVTELLKLKRIQDEIRINENFVSEFFDVCIKNDCLKKDKNGNGVGIKFTRQDENVSMLKAQLARIMQDYK